MSVSWAKQPFGLIAVYKFLYNPSKLTYGNMPQTHVTRTQNEPENGPDNGLFPHAYAPDTVYLIVLAGIFQYCRPSIQYRQSKSLSYGSLSPLCGWCIAGFSQPHWQWLDHGQGRDERASCLPVSRETAYTCGDPQTPENEHQVCDINMHTKVFLWCYMTTHGRYVLY